MRRSTHCQRTFSTDLAGEPALGRESGRDLADTRMQGSKARRLVIDGNDDRQADTTRGGMAADHAGGVTLVRAHRFSVASACRVGNIIAQDGFHLVERSIAVQHRTC
jgi:hypothetical protein